MRRAFALALLTAAATTGCAHRGLTFPGPLATMGDAPPPYADTVTEADAEPAPERAVASTPAEPPSRRARTRGAAKGEQVARTAAKLVGDRSLVVNGERFRYDCSGLVAAAHAGARVALAGSSRDLYELARDEGLLHKHKLPKPGDVAFFDDTYDRNHNRRRDDDLTHVAVVESVSEDGTITLVHKGGKGIARIEMNLKRPHDRRDEDGRELNDYLRASSDKDGGPTLTGELFRAFASLWATEDGPATADARD
jgi:hypothetical protein